MCINQYGLGIPYGKPGIGARSTPANSSINSVQLGPRDRVAPNPVDLKTVAVAAFPDRVDLHWQGVTDDANGIGLYQYSVYRDSTGLAGFLATEGSISDRVVSPENNYTYSISPSDFHFNQTTPPTLVPVRTPPAGFIDPRRVGVKANGAYWGATGEQIDMLSGNLNYTLPAVSAIIGKRSFLSVVRQGNIIRAEGASHPSDHQPQIS